MLVCVDVQEVVDFWRGRFLKSIDGQKLEKLQSVLYVMEPRLSFVGGVEIWQSIWICILKLAEKKDLLSQPRFGEAA
jgi:hypothetical protein